jgi:hypothetical protein
MMHFVTLTISPPRTDHSLIHNSTRGMSLGQKGLQVRFRKNVHFGPFSWVIAHNFQDWGQFFCNIPDVHRLLVGDIWRGFHLLLDRGVHVSGIFSARLGACGTKNYLLKRKPE